jgi:glycosyltransferase involved in cell wall biosynthesis
MTNDAVPFVSVVIATRNRAALLAETLSAVTSQDWRRDRFEVIVADNGSTDETRVVVDDAASGAAEPLIRYLYVPQSGKSYAVNAALAGCEGSLIALTDDDVIPSRSWLRSLANAFDETGADFVAGRILPRWQSLPPSWLSPSLYGVLAIPDNGTTPTLLGTEGSPDIMPIGANMAVRAHVVARLGGLRTDLGKLDGTLRTGEDHEFYLRLVAAGFRGAYAPDALVHHLVPTTRLTPGYFGRWLYQNGRDVCSLEASYPRRVRSLLGAPRYLWRETGGAATRACRAMLSGDRSGGFGAALRVLWFAGYLREAWFGGRGGPSEAASADLTCHGQHHHRHV